jgi:hypothetical protein
MLGHITEIVSRILILARSQTLNSRISDGRVQTNKATYLVILGIPFVRIRTSLEPLLVLRDGEEIFDLFSLPDLEDVFNENRTETIPGPTLTIGVTNSTKNLELSAKTDKSDPRS